MHNKNRIPRKILFILCFIFVIDNVLAQEFQSQKHIEARSILDADHAGGSVFQADSLEALNESVPAQEDSGEVSFTVKPDAGSEAVVLVIRQSRIEMKQGYVITSPIPPDTIGVWPTSLTRRVPFGQYNIIVSRKGFLEIVKKIDVRKNKNSFAVDMVLRDDYERKQDWRTHEAYTETSFGIGVGQTAYREGETWEGDEAYMSWEEVHRPVFVDVGYSIKYKFEAPFRIGLALGVIWLQLPVQLRPLPFAYPDLAFDDGIYSIGTTGIRVGKLQSIYFEARCFDEVPFINGRGAVRAGFGIPIKEGDSHVWVGANVGATELVGGILSYEWKVNDTKYLFVNGRYMSSHTGHETVPEFGVSFGFRWINRAQ
jgi:hypothetical protein